MVVVTPAPQPKTTHINRKIRSQTFQNTPKMTAIPKIDQSTTPKVDLRPSNTFQRSQVLTMPSAPQPKTTQTNGKIRSHPFQNNPKNPAIPKMSWSPKVYLCAPVLLRHMWHICWNTAYAVLLRPHVWLWLWLWSDLGTHVWLWLWLWSDLNTHVWLWLWLWLLAIWSAHVWLWLWLAKMES